MKKRIISTVTALALCLTLVIPVIAPAELCDCGYDLPPHTEEECPYAEQPSGDPLPPRDED